MSGDYAVVGAPYKDDAPSDCGAAYVFHRTGGNSWVQSARLTDPDPAAGNLFGAALAVHDDHVVVGAPLHGGSGAAYVFRRTGTDAWDGGTRIGPRDPRAGENFGAVVSIHEDRILVGAPLNHAGGTYAGAAYAFTMDDDGSWDAGVRILPEIPSAYTQFGSSVAVFGACAIIGSPGVGRGTVRVFRD